MGHTTKPQNNVWTNKKSWGKKRREHKIGNKHFVAAMLNSWRRKRKNCDTQKCGTRGRRNYWCHNSAKCIQWFFVACKTLNEKYMKTYMATAKITHKEILNTYVDKMKPKC